MERSGKTIKENEVYMRKVVFSLLEKASKGSEVLVTFHLLTWVVVS